MKTRLKLFTAALMLAGSMAAAEISTDQLVSDLQAEGYTFIDVKRGPTQIKIEAVRGTEKVETIIDRETGAVLKTETETASTRDQSRSGVRLRDRNRDFLRLRSGDDSMDDDDRDDDSDDDHGSDDDGRDDDDHDDDHGGDDDSHDDDHGGDDDGDDSDD
ncbi:MAG: PepSY domain-containing protein [Paracoccaceae bacterium]